MPRKPLALKKDCGILWACSDKGKRPAWQNAEFFKEL